WLGARRRGRHPGGGEQHPGGGEQDCQQGFHPARAYQGAAQTRRGRASPLVRNSPGPFVRRGATIRGRGDLRPWAAPCSWDGRTLLRQRQTSREAGTQSHGPGNRSQVAGLPRTRGSASAPFLRTRGPGGPAMHAPSLAGVRVLLVDDDEYVREALRDYFVEW